MSLLATKQISAINTCVARQRCNQISGNISQEQPSFIIICKMEMPILQIECIHKRQWIELFFYRLSLRRAYSRNQIYTIFIRSLNICLDVLCVPKILTNLTLCMTHLKFK